MKKHKYIVYGISNKQAELLLDVILLFINAAGLCDKAFVVLHLGIGGKHGKA